MTFGLTKHTGDAEMARRSSLPSNFGKLLKLARVRAGYSSARRFALINGIPIMNYQNWEADRSLPDLPTVARLCRLLDIAPDSVFTTLAPSKKKRSLAAA